MATEIATTQIRHGGEDGVPKVFEVGDEVTGLTEDQMAQLRLAGAVEVKTSATKTETEAQLRDKIAELESQLAAKSQASNLVNTPGNAAQTVQTQDSVDKGRTDAKTAEAVTKTNEKSEPAK